MRRLSLWLRARPMMGDGLLAAFLLFLHGYDWANNATGLGQHLLYGVAGMLLALPIAARRRWTVHAAYLVLIGALMFYSLQQPAFVPPLATEIMLYTLVVYHGRRQAALYTALILIGEVLRQYPDGFVGLGERLPVLLSLLLAPLVVCWLLGEFVGARWAYHAAVEQRVRNLEFERDQRARIAVAEERNRIAREIHDVLAHSMSVMISQADGASCVLRTDQEQAERALRAIGETGRESLAELRNLLSVLRNPDEDEAHRTPPPGSAGMRELAESVRRLGLRVDLDLGAGFDALPAGIGLSAHRVVQESLTNSLKHGDRADTVTVIARNDGHQLDLQISDNGSTALQTDAVDASQDGDLSAGIPSGGNGVLGMRERAGLYGGALWAGPAPEGGWQVRARLPLSTASTGQPDRSAEQETSGQPAEPT